MTKRPLLTVLEWKHGDRASSLHISWEGEHWVAQIFHCSGHVCNDHESTAGIGFGVTNKF